MKKVLLIFAVVGLSCLGDPISGDFHSEASPGFPDWFSQLSITNGQYRVFAQDLTIFAGGCAAVPTNGSVSGVWYLPCEYTPYAFINRIEPVLGGSVTGPGGALLTNYTLQFEFTFLGETMMLAPTLTGLFPPGMVITTTTGVLGQVSGFIELRDNGSGLCLWCDTFTGTGLSRGQSPAASINNSGKRMDISFSATSAVPEPNPVTYLGLTGVGGLLMHRWQRRRQLSTGKKPVASRRPFLP